MNTPVPINVELKSKHLGFSQVLGSALGVMGISGCVVIMVPLTFASAGNGTAFAFLLAMISYIFVALRINVFAKRIATSGSMYTYTQEGLGVFAGTAVGWAALLGYWAFVVVNAVAVPYYILLGARTVLGMAPAAPSSIWVAVSSGLASLVAWGLTTRGIKLSTRVILGVEFLTLSVIAVVFTAYFFQRGVHYDATQVHLGSVGFTPFALGLVLTLSCFTGFEAASVLGVEARLPHTMIPRANVLTILIAGLGSTLGAYVLVQHFHGLTPGLDKDEAPMTTLARALGLGVLGPVMLGGCGVSWFGCLMGCYNTGGRLLHGLARQGKLPAAIAKTHARHATPARAISIIAVSGYGVALVLLLRGVVVMDIITDLATFAAFGFIVAYGLVSIASVAYAHRLGKAWLPECLVAGLALVPLLIALIGSFYPPPQWPVNILPFLFAGALGCGLVYYAYVRCRYPQRIRPSDTLIVE